MRLLWLGLMAAACVTAQEISGTAVDSVTGAPLGKVLVEVTGASTTTDAHGHFTLSSLPPGQYQLTGARNGYLEATGNLVTLEAGQSVKDVQFKLDPFGVIAGTVRDSDGEPMAGIAVTVSRLQYDSHGRRRISREGTADTDDLGQYRIPFLERGRYYVRAEKETSPARQTDVGTGERVTGVDITLSHPSTVEVSGHATAPAGTNLSSVRLNAGEDGLSFTVNAQVSSNGDFVFRGVPSGVYTLTAEASPPKRPSSDFYELIAQGRYRTHVPIIVGADPVKDIKVTVDAGTEVSGHLNVRPSATTAIVFDGDGDQVESAYVHNDQTFSVNLARGHYNINRNIMNGYIVHSIQFDGRDIQDEGLTIAGPGKVSLEITLGKDGGRVDGIVADKNGRPVPGATVVLVPEASRRSHSDLFQNVEADQQGHYKIETIPPGKYQLFAWEEDEDNVWMDPDFLITREGQGQPVEIGAHSHQTANLTLANNHPAQ